MSNLIFRNTSAPTEAFRIDSSGNLGIGGTTTFKSTVTAPGGVVTDMDSVRSAQLDHEVFDAAIETLLDLWVARYGNEWVDIDKIMNDEFFALAYKRLRSLGQLEQHYLTDRARFVCRKPT